MRPLLLLLALALLGGCARKQYNIERDPGFCDQHREHYCA